MLPQHGLELARDAVARLAIDAEYVSAVPIVYVSRHAASTSASPLSRCRTGPHRAVLNESQLIAAMQHLVGAHNIIVCCRPMAARDTAQVYQRVPADKDWLQYQVGLFRGAKIIIGVWRADRDSAQALLRAARRRPLQHAVCRARHHRDRVPPCTPCESLLWVCRIGLGRVA